MNNPFNENRHLSLDGKPLDESRVDLTKVASAKREMVFEEVFVRVSKSWYVIYVNIFTEVICFTFNICSYLNNPFNENRHLSLDGKPLDESRVDLTKVASAKREMVFEEVFVSGKQRPDLPLTTLYVTQEAREAASQLTKIRKKDLIKMIENLVARIEDDFLLDAYKNKLSLIQQRLSSTEKEVIISLYEEINQLHQRVDVDYQGDGDDEAEGE